MNAKIPPFIDKLRRILESEKYSSFIYWNTGPDQSGFTVCNEERLSSEVLPLFYKHGNFHSFVRQLNNYGFHKAENSENHMVFENPYFVHGRPDLLLHIVRKVPPGRLARRRSNTDGSCDSYDPSGSCSSESQESSALSSLEMLAMMATENVPEPVPSGVQNGYVTGGVAGGRVEERELKRVRREGGGDDVNSGVVEEMRRMLGVAMEEIERLKVRVGELERICGGKLA